MQERFKTFTLLISSISRNIRKIKTGEMEDYNLKSPHVSCLYYLYIEKELTAKELCDICQEDKAAVSRSIEYLEKNNYIVCDSTQKKRYKNFFTLTDKGEKIAKEISHKIDSILDIASEGLSENDRVNLYKSLNLINENLENFCNKYTEN